MSSENWKKGKAESAMIEFERQQMAKAKELFKNRKVERNLTKELQDLGFTDEQCISILKWTETLPIHLVGKNCSVNIEQGVVKILDNSNES